nr:hypothetical protein [uncultured Flavobacterium sp.]
MITLIKNGIVTALNDLIQSSRYNTKITKDNFLEESRKNPASLCEISVQYVSSEWEPINDNLHEQIYNRHLNFNLFIRFKDLREEDKAQDFSDFIIDNLSIVPILGRYLRIETDEFSEYVEGIWVYRQSWIYTISSLKPDPTCQNVTETNVTGIEIYISPSYEFPLEFDEDLATEIQ